MGVDRLVKKMKNISKTNRLLNQLYDAALFIINVYYTEGYAETLYFREGPEAVKKDPLRRAIKKLENAVAAMEPPELRGEE